MSSLDVFIVLYKNYTSVKKFVYLEENGRIEKNADRITLLSNKRGLFLFFEYAIFENIRYKLSTLFPKSIYVLEFIPDRNLLKILFDRVKPKCGSVEIISGFNTKVSK